MAPQSYQGKLAANGKDKRTFSQSLDSNLAEGVVTVEAILKEKGTIIYTTSPGETIASAVAELRARKIGVMVVTEGETLVGILSERDVVRHLDEQGPQVLNATVADLMTAEPFTCDRDTPLLSVLRRMTDGHFRHMPVLEDGKLLGLISIGDVVKARLRQLEYEALRMKQMIVG